MGSHRPNVAKEAAEVLKFGMDDCAPALDTVLHVAMAGLFILVQVAGLHLRELVNVGFEALRVGAEVFCAPSATTDFLPAGSPS